MNSMTEDTLVQQTTADYLRQDLHWDDSVYAMDETLGKEGTLGRESEKELVLSRYLGEALMRLNPGLPVEAYSWPPRGDKCLPLYLFVFRCISANHLLSTEECPGPNLSPTWHSNRASAKLNSGGNAMSAIMSLPMPSALGSIEGYVQAVNRFPVLSHEEELSLATRFKNENDLDAARQLVLSHLRVVVSVARGYAGYGLPQADLIQEGNIGLMKAVKRFDPARGVRLVSFALHWIRAEIHEYVIRNWRMVKIATTKAQRKLFFNLRSLKEGLEPLRPQQVSEIAKQLNVSEHDVVEMDARFAGHELALDPLAGEEDDSYAPINYLADNEEHEPSCILEAAERDHLHTSGLSNALASLDERSRRIVEARWLREEESATLHELAAEFNVSAERIRQIEQKALSKMQAQLALPAA